LPDVVVLRVDRASWVSQHLEYDRNRFRDELPPTFLVGET
jgi:hypothetical protein